MTPRWRSLLFIVVAGLMQLAFAEQQPQARADAVELCPGALGETRLADAQRALPGLREAPTVERGAKKRNGDGKPEGVVAPPAAAALATGDAVIAAAPPASAGAIAGAPGERFPTGPPAAA